MSALVTVYVSDSYAVYTVQRGLQILNLELAGGDSVVLTSRKAHAVPRLLLQALDALAYGRAHPDREDKPTEPDAMPAQLRADLVAWLGLPDDAE